MSDPETLKKLESIETYLRNLNGVGADVKNISKEVEEISHTVAELDRKLDKLHEKVISNSKDIEYQERRITEFKELWEREKELLWAKIHKHEEDQKKDRVNIIIEAIKGAKLWVVTAIAIAMSTIILNLIKYLAP